jgi:hypothetical protein
MLPQELGCGSGMSCWPRLRDWQKVGIWQLIHFVTLDRLARHEKINWSRAVVDGSSIRAVFWGQKTGPNPTDRANWPDGAKRDHSLRAGRESASVHQCEGENLVRRRRFKRVLIHLPQCGKVPGLKCAAAERRLRWCRGIAAIQPKIVLTGGGGTRCPLP